MLYNILHQIILYEVKLYHDTRNIWNRRNFPDSFDGKLIENEHLYSGVRNFCFLCAVN